MVTLRPSLSYVPCIRHRGIGITAMYRYLQNNKQKNRKICWLIIPAYKSGIYSNKKTLPVVDFCGSWTTALLLAKPRCRGDAVSAVTKTMAATEMRRRVSVIRRRQPCHATPPRNGLRRQRRRRPHCSICIKIFQTAVLSRYIVIPGHFASHISYIFLVFILFILYILWLYTL